MVSNDAQPLILLDHDFVGSGVKFMIVDGGEQGGVYLELPVDGPFEVRIARKVQVIQHDQRQETVSQDLSLCITEIAQTFLVHPNPSITEEGVEGKNKTLYVNNK